MEQSRSERTVRLSLLILPVAFLLLVFIYPLYSVARLALQQGALDEVGYVLHIGLDLSGGFPWLELSRYWDIIFFTFEQALLATALALLLGLGIAALMVTTRIPAKPLWRSLLTVPFVLPTLVVAIAFAATFGADGWVTALLRPLGLEGSARDLLGPFWMIVIAHVFYNTAVAIRVIEARWATLPRGPYDAARTLGYGPLRAWWRADLPRLRGALLAAGLLIFLLNFASFGVVLILGNGRVRTLEVAIFQEAVRLGSLEIAFVLLLIQALVVWILVAFLVRRPGTAPEVGRQRSREADSPVRMVLFFAALGLMLFPLVALVAGSVGNGDLTLAGYQALGEEDGSIFAIDYGQALWNTARFGVGTVLLSVTLGFLLIEGLHGLPTQWRPRVEAWFIMPLGISAVTIGIGMLLGINPWFRDAPELLWLVIIAGHSLIALPFVLRILGSGRDSVTSRLEEAAASLGHGPFARFRRVTLPILRRPLAAAGVFAFAISIGEFGASAVLYRPELVTIPTAIDHVLGRARIDGLLIASALSVVLLAVTLAAFLAIEWLQRGRKEALL